jgi:elongation factor P--(R)-beta-lysine ligase
MMSVSDDWRPTATRTTLVERAAMLARMRGWFMRRGILEVETPQLSRAAVADRHIECLSLNGGDGPRWLQPSPEGAMKRLLADGSGDIFQVARVFRAGESGRQHNPEFTLLEWYRIGRSLHEVIEEVAEFVAEMLDTPVGTSTRHRYHELLGTVLSLDLLTATDEEIRHALTEWELEPPPGGDRETLMDFAMAALVTPQLGLDGVEFVTHFPAHQASLAALDPSDESLALRFECFLGGRELANGYVELTDADEQRDRLRADQRIRAAAGQELRPVDERLISALTSGLPVCTGVALGFDRLLMHHLACDDISEVLAFDWGRA